MAAFYPIKVVPDGMNFKDPFTWYVHAAVALRTLEDAAKVGKISATIDDKFIDLGHVSSNEKWVYFHAGEEQIRVHYHDVQEIMARSNLKLERYQDKPLALTA